MDDLARKRMTAEEYFALEENSLERHEFYRGKKFHAYRTIPSLQTYILVSTNYKQIEVFTKLPEGTWNLSEIDKEGKVYTISQKELHLAVAKNAEMVYTNSLFSKVMRNDYIELVYIPSLEFSLSSEDVYDKVEIET